MSLSVVVRRARAAVSPRRAPSFQVSTDRSSLGRAVAARVLAFFALAVLMAVGPAGLAAQNGSFTLAQVKSAPFPSELTASATGARIAWVFDEQGVRNVYVAEAPDWKARKLTPYTDDDGQEITSLRFSHDGATVVYVRGGDHGENWEVDGGRAPDPAASVGQPKIQIFAVPFAGGEPTLLSDGDDPAISPSGTVAFVKNNTIWTMPLDGSTPAAVLFQEQGRNGGPTWAPDGSKLAFTSRRGDHSFIGVFSDSASPIEYLDVSTERDMMPVWSPDGKQIAFVRRPGGGGPPEPWLKQVPDPWQIRVADVATAQGRQVWASPVTLWGSYPRTEGQANLHWAAGDRLVFLSDMDGWPHLYSVPVAGGKATLLTPHDGMAEYISMSPDGKHMLFAGNMGSGKDDIERRHVMRTATDRAKLEDLTPGEQMGWTPFVTGDGNWIAYIAAGARKPPTPAAQKVSGGKAIAIGTDRIPADFPEKDLVVPRAVTFQAEDGVTVHADLFERPGGAAKKPAVIFIHGGPPRQMLLGWHYSYYYSNALRREPVPGQPGLRGAGRELPPGHRLRPRLPPPRRRRRARRLRVPRHQGGRPLPASPEAGGPRAHRALGRLLRRLPHRPGPGPRLRDLRHRRRSSRRP